MELNYAVADFIAAYNDAAGRPNPDFIDQGHPPGHMNGGISPHNISTNNLMLYLSDKAPPTNSMSGRVLTEGLYNWGMPLITGGTIVLNGTSTSVFIFQVNGTIQFNGDTNIVLNGGTIPQNVFWQASDQVVLSPSAIVKGIILGREGIVFQSMASLNGRAIAGTFIKLIGSTILEP